MKDVRACSRNLLKWPDTDYITFDIRKDYSVGDMVTARDKGWGVTMDTRITAATVICEYGKRKVAVVFDNDKPTFISKMRREIDAFKYELKK